MNHEEQEMPARRMPAWFSNLKSTIKNQKFLPFLAWLGGLGLVFAWMLVLRAMGLLFPGNPPETGLPLLDAWASSDTVFYLGIARDGYTEPVTSLFYPLYPLLGRLVSGLLGIHPLAALLLISSLATLGFLMLLYRLVAADFGEAAARRTLAAAVLFPSSFYLWAGYPQALVLLLGAATWLLARKRHWWAACLAGLLAGLSHSTAVLLCLPLLVIGLRQARSGQGWRRLLDLLPAGFPGVGIAAFWGWRLLAGYESFHTVEYIRFQRIQQWPWQTLAQAVEQAFTSPQMMPRINLLFLTLVALVFAWSLRRTPREYQAHLLGGLVLGLISSSQVEALWSYTRFAGVLFPQFIALALWMQKRWAGPLILALLLGGWLFLSAVFLSGAWVA